MDNEQKHACSRKSIRLKHYDYRQCGAYFLTICTNGRRHLFGEIIEDQMHLNNAGQMVQSEWESLAARFSQVDLDHLVIMPNHAHGVLVLTVENPGVSLCGENERDITHGPGEHKVRPYGTLPGSLGRVVQAFKSATTYAYIQGVREQGWTRFDGKLWQRNYYEHVVRCEEDLNEIRDYILTNPLRWSLDPENRG